MQRLLIISVLVALVFVGVSLFGLSGITHRTPSAYPLGLEHLPATDSALCCTIWPRQLSVATVVSSVEMTKESRNKGSVQIDTTTGQPVKVIALPAFLISLASPRTL